MKLLSLFLILLTLVSCNSQSGESVSSGYINKKAPYLWGSYTAPKKLEISKDFNIEERAAIKEMALAWTESVGSKKTFFEVPTELIEEKSNTITSLNQLLDKNFAIYKTTKWPSRLPGSALAVTQLFGERWGAGTSNEHVDIKHADILINYHLYRFYASDKISGQFDLKSVVLHEMGHFIGLLHRDKNDDSVMIPEIGSNYVNRVPTTLDQYDLADKYNIDLGLSNHAMVSDRPSLKKTGKSEEVIILIELHASGECVHKENGVVVQRHSAKD